jgi:hypothetical protein
MDGNGVVCLNFNRYGDGSLPTYSNKRADLQQVTNSSIQKPSHNGLRAAASFEMKGRHNLPLGGSINKKGTVYTINQSSSKSSDNIIPDNEVLSRRSRTFKVTMPSMHRSAALIHKNFMQTFRNIGYEFISPWSSAVLILFIEF